MASCKIAGTSVLLHRGGQVCDPVLQTALPPLLAPARLPSAIEKTIAEAARPERSLPGIPFAFHVGHAAIRLSVPVILILPSIDWQPHSAASTARLPFEGIPLLA